MPKVVTQFFVIAAVVAIIMVFIIQFRPGTNVQTAGAPQCAIEVGGDCIPYSDYQTAFRLAAPPNVDGEQLERMRLRQIVTEGLLERWLLLRDAERLGLTVSDDEVTKQLGQGFMRVSLPAERELSYSGMLRLLPPPYGPARYLRAVMNPQTGKFEYKRYERTIRELTSKTPTDFRDTQRDEILAGRVRALVRSRVRVSEPDAFAKFALEGQKAVVDYIRIERSYYRSHVLDQSEAAILKWTNDNQETVDKNWEPRKEDFLPECRVTRHLLIKAEKKDGVAEAAADEAARTAAVAARKRVQDGEAFAAVAKELSADSGSAKVGGELGCIAKNGKMVKPFEDAVFAAKEGEVSEPVKSPFGYHLIVVEKIATGDAAEQMGRLQVARDLYLDKESERLAAEAAKQIRAAIAGGKSTDDAIKAHLDAVLPVAAPPAAPPGEPAPPPPPPPSAAPEGEPLTARNDPTRPRVQTSEPFTVEGPPFSGAQQPGDAARMVFAIEKVGDVASDAIKLFDGYAIAILKEKTPVTEAEWEEQRLAYMAQLRQDKEQDALVDYMRRLRAKYAADAQFNRSLTETKEQRDQKEKEKGTKKEEPGSG